MFKKTIIKLIEKKYEGTYWDFKQEYHRNKARLLHDIICLANNIDNREAYLIFGVTDNAEIVGIEEHEKRMNQEKIISFLRGKRFAGTIVPQVILKTLNIGKHIIDVLVIQKSDKLPYYLEEEFLDGKIRVYPGSIYTRVEDCNTPINKTADPYQTEILWKIRFGLCPKPLERLKLILLLRNKWNFIQNGYYFDESPEFTIVENLGDLDSYETFLTPYYAYYQTNSTTHYQSYQCKYHNTVLFEAQTVTLDSGQYKTPIPERDFIDIRDSLSFRYFIEGSVLFNMHLFMYDEQSQEATYAREKFLDTTLIFYSENERLEFRTYIFQNIRSVIKELDEKCEENLVFDINDKHKKAIVNKEIHMGLLLVEHLKEFRGIQV
ncbi:ATP-binding protein [Jeotgalibaca sp. MA1X17-3]|uniref:AlbA family DNA-binding domain-containing protein n=1 Tax=Jeotgalibaca sp. MA1X17-3 TaxID=2908211 RepID=UPI001F2A0A2A|nr:ATP-binding protein [Jeotgalibaca sp. MA1X17-3]UJF15963.1 ATP-binding protein [Jeotgalibaca sp. MA1X17-3]